MHSTPQVSVIIPVYNREKSVGAALESIRSQTLKDIEIVVIDDCSTDRSYEIVKAIDDPRIRLLQNPQNSGVARTENVGLDAATADYVAIMHSDDTSLPQRLERQLQFMKSHPDLGILCSYAIAMTRWGPAPWRTPLDPGEIAATLMFGNPICHPTVMMDKRVLNKHGLRYDEGEHKSTEDYEMWCKAAKVTQIGCLPEALVRYHVHPNQLSKTDPTTNAQAQKLRLQELALFGIEPTEEELLLHNLLGGYDAPSTEELQGIEAWLLKLRDHNRNVKHFEDNMFSRLVSTRWYSACRRYPWSGGRALSMYWKSPLRGAGTKGLRDALFLTGRAAKGMIRRRS